ncbi:MAG: ABC transporter substrate-binding protein [Alphaproteobacteria bacterium]|nr:ABC transporter substrate-binding protein [Alphaproteobacteria bacterium]
MKTNQTAFRTPKTVLRSALVVLLLVVAAPPQPAQAQSAADARALVQNLADRALKILADKSISKASREAEFAKLFINNFHTRSIGVFVLGRHWRRATPTQRKAYLAVFQRLIVKTYTVRLSQYAGEQFRVRKATGPNGGAYSVDSVVLQPGRASIPLRWSIRRARSGLKIVDVVIENLSMAQTQRDEFAAILRRRGSIDGLIKALQEKMQTLDKG